MNDTGYRGHWKKNITTTDLSSKEEQSTQENREDVAMGEILLPGDKGFDNGVVQIWKGKIH